MKKHILAAALLAAFFQAYGQTEQLGKPVSWTMALPAVQKTLEMPAVDNAAEIQKDADDEASSHLKVLRFGVEQAVNTDIMQQAEITQLPNGDVVRRLRIHDKNALSINVIFSAFELKPGSRLYLYGKNQPEFIGAHTSLNNNENRVLGTELIHGDELTIELTEPAATAGTSTLVLGTVVHGYRDLEKALRGFNGSGACEYDVNCSIGNGWEYQRNSVAFIIAGGGYCSGSLINNTSGTIIPYFMSARHCGTTTTSWVFRFRWEAPADHADCGTTALSGSGPTTMVINGSTLKANYALSDFLLMELNAAPDPAWGVYYNGWSRSETPAVRAAGIHHPQADIKKISFEYDTLVSAFYTSSTADPDSHWEVTHWDKGVTEGGSSGSPLFDQNHRFIGQLHGGLSACGHRCDLSDVYGKFSVSWTGDGTSTGRLSNWLDPGNLDPAFIDGVDPASADTLTDAAVVKIDSVTGTICDANLNPVITIANFGTAPLTSATIHYGFDGSTAGTYNWTGNLPRYASAAISLSIPLSLAAGDHTFGAVIGAPNGNTDQNPANNGADSTFHLMPDFLKAHLTLTLDCYGTEIDWELRDSLTHATVFSGGPYCDDAGGTVIHEAFCLEEACYKFTIYDASGDGLTSSGCAVDGSYSLTNEVGVEVARLTTAQANFGTENAQQFCMGSASVNELNDLPSWSVYPNPASEFITVDMSAIEGSKTIRIQAATGQVVREITSTEAQLGVTVSGLSKGVYFLNLSSENGNSTKTFVVK